MSTGEIRALVDEALLVIDDQLEIIAASIDTVGPLHRRLAEALAGSRHPDAELFVARVDEMVRGLQTAMGGGTFAGAPGQRLIHNLS